MDKIINLDYDNDLKGHKDYLAIMEALSVNHIKDAINLLKDYMTNEDDVDLNKEVYLLHKYPDNQHIINNVELKFFRVHSRISRDILSDGYYFIDRTEMRKMK